MGVIKSQDVIKYLSCKAIGGSCSIAYPYCKDIDSVIYLGRDGKRRYVFFNSKFGGNGKLRITEKDLKEGNYLISDNYDFQICSLLREEIMSREAKKNKHTRER